MKTKKIFALFSCLALVTACGGGDTSAEREKAMEDAAAAHGVDADVTVNAAGEVDKVVINAPGGAKTGKNLDLPSGFPDDIAVGNDWDIMMTSPVPGGGFSMQASSKQDSETLIGSLKDRMQESGWTVANERSPTPMMHMIGFEKDNRLANFNLMANADSTVIQLATMVKP